MGQTISSNSSDSSDSPSSPDANGTSHRLRRATSTSPRPVRGGGDELIRFDPLSRTYRARSTPLSTPSEPVDVHETRQRRPTRMVTRSMARQSRSRAMAEAIRPFRGPPRRSGSSPSLRQPDHSSSGSILAPSLIADVITEAVLSAFRERHGSMESAANAVAHAAAAAAVTVAANAAAAANNDNPAATVTVATPPPPPTNTTTTATRPPVPVTSTQNEQQRPMAQEETTQATTPVPTIRLQATPTTGESSEESFFRYVRLPVTVMATPESSDPEQRPDMAMPMFIVGYRVRPPSEDLHHHHSPEQQERNNAAETESLRRSPRIAERDDRRQQQQQQQPSEEDQQHSHNVASRWVVYILSGVGEGGLSGLSDSPTYEELLGLAESIGYARNPINVDQINASAPIQQYTVQVGGAMMGNTEQCLICLEVFQELESVRVLKCHHGFHQNCIDKWLTEGQNRCPLCRVTPVERVSQPE